MTFFSITWNENSALVSIYHFGLTAATLLKHEDIVASAARRYG